MIPKKQEPIKILRGNDVTLLAALYDRNNLGELVALPLADMELNVSVYSPRQGVQSLHYDIASGVTLLLRCDAGTFDEVGVYSLEIKATSEARNIRFAVQTAIKVVNYVEEVHPDGGCEEPYSVVNIPPQVACGAHVRFAQFAGQASAGGGSGASSEEIAALAEKVADFERELNIIEYFVSAQEKTNEATANELTNIAEQLRGNSAEVAALASNVQNMQNSIADIDGEVKEVAEEQEAQGQRLTATEGKAAANEGKITTLGGVVAANKAEVDELKTGIGEQIVPMINQVMTALGNVSNAVEQQGIAIEGINAQLQGIDTALTNILGEEV